MDPTLKALSELFDRDLKALQEAIEEYKDPENLWKMPGNINNSAGNLCLHIEGNLKSFIGNILGEEDFERDREMEFSAKEVNQEELIQRLETTNKVVQRTLNDLDPSVLEKPFPKDVLGGNKSTRFFLLHLSGHLQYHLGQVDYHHRVVEGEKKE